LGLINEKTENEKWNDIRDEMWEILNKATTKY
jgi:hypothetical protein